MSTGMWGEAEERSALCVLGEVTSVFLCTEFQLNASHCDVSAHDLLSVSVYLPIYAFLSIHLSVYSSFHLPLCPPCGDIPVDRSSSVSGIMAIGVQVVVCVAACVPAKKETASAPPAKEPPKREPTDPSVQLKGMSLFVRKLQNFKRPASSKVESLRIVVR